MDIAIGATIRRIRTEQGKSLREIPFVAVGYLSEVERGQKSPSGRMFENIAHGLSLTTAGLLKEIYEYLEEHDVKNYQ